MANKGTASNRHNSRICVFGLSPADAFRIGVIQARPRTWNHLSAVFMRANNRERRASRSSSVASDGSMAAMYHVLSKR